MGELINLTGQNFGRLWVIGQAQAPNGETRAFWNCVCECGNTKAISGKYLRNGTTRSCGCLMSDKSKMWMSSAEFAEHRRKGATSHGHKTRSSGPSSEYRSWLQMKRRCYDSKFKDFANYGARGIIVCDRWNSSFENFLTDMGSKPTPQHQIDRLNPNDHYYKNNCRWVTASVQSSENRRNIKSVTVNGIYFPSMAAACRHFGVRKTTAHYRISIGVAVELAVSQPDRKKSDRDRLSYLPKNHPDRC